MKKIIIAIDGHSSCGKSTIAKDVAKLLQFSYVDTGAMYRSVTLFCIENNLVIDGKIDEENLRKQLAAIKISFKYNPETKRNETWLNGVNVEEKIRGMQVASLVSPVATIGFVRKELVRIQRDMGIEKGIVMDGRDIGTVVFPEAELKLFVTASADVRAERRFKELSAKGTELTLEEVKANLLERDHIDSTREESPLMQADDALVLDNSFMTMSEQTQWVINKVQEL